ncbi:MAG: hypothetical protein PHF70_08145 [Opitutales bacterium]|nr:hypothetical protein [Opitutales bacterium]
MRYTHLVCIRGQVKRSRMRLVVMLRLRIKVKQAGNDKIFDRLCGSVACPDR